MKIRNVENKEINRVRSILLGDGHFLSRLKKKSTSPTWSYFDTKNNNGITLIALIITIIILLILAGVVISITIGENGLFSTAKYSVVKTEEEKAREKLELALADLTSHKYANTDYNENDIDKYLSKESIIVIEDIVIVDGWKFSIDRSVPQIIESLGKGEESKTIAITTNIENASDYTKAIIKIEITYKGTIKEIKINGEQQEIPQKNEEEKYVIEKEVTTNGKYTIYVKDENDEYKTNIANVTEISEDMEIENANDLVYFRDRVNKGATYVGRTVTVVNDIDLSKVCYKVDGTISNDVSWNSIGNSKNVFSGTFDGNNHTISNIYIKTDRSIIGLFGKIQGAKIKNIIIDNSSIEAADSVGIIAGVSYENSTLENIHTTKSNIVIATNPAKSGIFVGGIVGHTTNTTISKVSNSANVIGNGWYIGGIVGITFEGTSINESYNAGNIKSHNVNTDNIRSIGGIVGSNCGNTVINNCYNIGIIEGKSRVGGISGSVHENPMLTINNCYNGGNIIATSDFGEIVGIDISANRKINNCYSKSQVITASILGNSYTDDEQNQNGTWKYNEGLPILKWQKQ